MIYTKDEKAITIVALVITITTMLILLTITLQNTFSNNKIIERTKLAKEEIQYAVNLENEEMESSYMKMDEQNLVRMFCDGRINIGDYVKYSVPENKEFITTAFGDECSNGFELQKFNTSNNGVEINWRILGLADKNGNITLNKDEGRSLLIISGSPVQKVIDEQSESEFKRIPYLYMGKAEGYENSSNILNGICSIYLNSNYANSARSINANDINRLLNIEVDYEHSRVFNKNNPETNIDTVKSMGNLYTINGNGYSSESYAKYRERENNRTITSKSFGYEINDFRSGKLGELLFSGTDENSRYAKSYWIDSKSPDVINRAYFCIGKVYMDSLNLANSEFSSNGKWNVYGLGVYPVITLKPDLTCKDLEIVNRTEVPWNYSPSLCYTGNIENYETMGKMKRIIN